MSDNAGDNIYQLADKVLSIVQLIVVAFILLVLGLVVFYCYLLISPEIEGSSPEAVLTLLSTLWQSVSGYVARFAALIAPVFILLFGLGVFLKLSDSKVDLSEGILSDLPSVLALIIIVAICLLPFANIEIPQVLSNVALVVVGFYFGKRRSTDSGV